MRRRRSKHSNAYFTGIGKVKRIVLYDTLIKQMSHGEIVAVLAHEIGHWKKGHIWKRLLWAEVLALAGSWISFELLAWHGLPGLLALSGEISLPARMVILGFIASLVLFPLTPFSAWRSRCHEREADRFAADLTGGPQDLASALIKMSAENLSNLFPHPLYAAFYYSHPPIVERVRQLQAWARTPDHQSVASPHGCQHAVVSGMLLLLQRPVSGLCCAVPDRHIPTAVSADRF